MTKEKKVKKIFRGIVVSDKMKKTLVVKVERMKLHPKYQKRYKISRRFKVHDEQEKYKIGETVSFVECRPLSKEKRWRVLYK
ncbi:MAG: 30S ribosomal protein S17 [bacterium]